VGGYEFEWRPGVANLDAAAFLFLATGVTPAMDARIVGEGQKKDLLVNAGGSVDVHFGPKLPPGKEPSPGCRPRRHLRVDPRAAW
jgi:hypothetical protein